MPDDLIDRVADEIAAGRPVDWAAVFSACATAEERAQLESLQRLQRLTQFGGTVTTDSDTRPGVDRPRGELSPGDRWGRYRVLEQIAAGSYGSVYRARDDEVGQEIALKVLHSHVDDPAVREKLIAEARALAKVRHANVVRVIGVEFHGNRVALCTDLIRGDTLEEEVHTRGTFGEAETAAIGKAICAAVAAVHGAGLVHRDVKARNIIRERNTGRIVLVDFGAGRDILEELESSSVALEGTALYMAPEVLLRQQPASEASDVYSIGVLLYYLLTDTYPVERSTLRELRDAHEAGDRTPLADRRPDVSPQFLRVVARALAPARKDRIPTAGALLEELGRSGWVGPTWQHRLGTSAVVAAVALLYFGSLGLITSYAFNMTLGRLNFVDEGIGTWIYFGVRSMLAPSFIAGFTVLAMTVVASVKQLLTRMSPTARNVERLAMASLHRWSLDDAGVVSSIALVVSTAILFVTWWYFAPLLGAMLSADISTARVDQIALLAPEYDWYHLLYRKAFIAATVACVIVWYYPVRLVIRGRQRTPRAAFAGGVVVMVLMLVLLDFPWRLLTQSQTFAEARWNGLQCYELGEHGSERLLFCPDLDPPRNRVVRADSVVTEGEPAHGISAGGYEAKMKHSVFRFASRSSSR